MQTMNIGTYTATLSPTRNVGELAAKLAKCTGKFKPSRIVGGMQRRYPKFDNGMSTAFYVAEYESMNLDKRINGLVLITRGFWAPLNDAPCTLYTGEDFNEIVDDTPAFEFAPPVAEFSTHHLTA